MNNMQTFIGGKMGHRGVVHFVMLGFSAMASAAGKSILSASGSLPPINAVTYMVK